MPGGARLLLLLLATLPALTGWCGCGWCAEGEVVVAAGAAGAGVAAFDPRVPRDVIARLGHSATLQCTVLHLNNKSVSWVRSRDLQILTYDRLVFTADSRVSLAPSAGAGGGGAAGRSHSTHALTIDRLRSSDAGRYECQLNTDPKMSLFFNLTVVDEAPPATVVRVLGAEGAEGAAGGAATLACEARLEPAPRALPPPPPPPLEVHWLHDGRPVGLETGRGGVSLQTERWPTRVESRLTLAGLRPSDEGLYTCRAASGGAEGGASASLRLYVRGSSGGTGYSAGEVMEAMQRDQTARGAARARGRGRGRGGALCAAALLLLLALRPA